MVAFLMRDRVDLFSLVDSKTSGYANQWPSGNKSRASQNRNSANCSSEWPGDWGRYWAASANGWPFLRCGLLVVSDAGTLMLTMMQFSKTLYMKLARGITGCHLVAQRLCWLQTTHHLMIVGLSGACFIRALTLWTFMMFPIGLPCFFLKCDRAASDFGRGGCK